MENSTVNDGAAAFIETLNALGIDRVFLNPGIDLVPLMAAVARLKTAGRRAPRIILCTDEAVAVAAAHGCAVVSGKPQVVAVFEDVGTLQGGGAIVNLRYGRVPVILCAGKNSAPGRVNWMGEPFDQRRIVRDYVKWDHEVRVGEDISSVLRAAVEIAGDEPCGPVYVTFAQEALMGKNGDLSVSAPTRFKRPGSSGDDARVLDQAAEILIRAENPLIMAAYSGRHVESVDPLIELAETLGARVVTTDLRMNFPSTHPLCPGIDCIKGDCYDHYIAEADVLFLLDYDFPGPIGKRFAPKEGAKIVHLDIEPLKHGRPLWDRLPDILIEGKSRRLLPALNEAVRKLLTPEQTERFRSRLERLGDEHKKLKDDWREVALRAANTRPISPEWLCRCINETLDDDAIIVHQIPSHADALSHQLQRTKPGTMFCWGDSAGSMGWSLGAALGAKLAAPDKLVVSLIGDGGFIYGCPTATLWGSAAYNAPFLSIIFNNSAYAIFREVMGMFYGEDMEKLVSGDLGFELGIDIRNPPDFAGIAMACHAHGQRVDDPSDLMSALERAIREVRAGRSAVLDVKLSP
jgi:acetolactate synthase I/II/III large subunit